MLALAQELHQPDSFKYNLVKGIAWLFTLLLPSILALGQTVDPGSGPSDSANNVSNNADSTHHTDTTHFHYNYAGTGTLNNTNSLHSFILNNALKLSMVKQSSALNFTNNWVYGRQNAVLTNNDLSSSLDMGLYKTLKHFYYWGMANYTTSKSLLINHQLQTGLGPGYNLIDKKKAVLLVSDGPIYEIGDLFDSLYGGPNGTVYQRDMYHTFRNSFHLLYHWILQDRYTFDGSGFLENAFSNWNDYNLKLNASLSIKLKKWLSFTAAAAYNRFTRTRSQNTLLTFGLTIQR
jgi:hypothetical protein